MTAEFLNKRLPSYLIIFATVCFCIFTVCYEDITAKKAEMRIHEHAKIVSDDLWNFNSEGAAEYLRLVAEADEYISLEVINHNGEVFQSVTTNHINNFERFLARVGINPIVTLLAPVQTRTDIIGWIEAVWVPKTYFIEAYVFIFLLLVCMTTVLYGRVYLARTQLEKRVEERTRELVETNKNMAQEYDARIKAQEEQEKLRARLEQSRKMESLGLLAGGVAHDLNNVLSGIVSYPDLLLQDLDRDDSRRKVVETIRDTGLRAAQIVQDLLTLARRGVVEKKAVKLESLVREYMGSPEYTKLLEANPEVRVEFICDSALRSIIGSPSALEKVVMNLVSNAVEAQQGGGLVTIHLAEAEVTEPLSTFQKIEPGVYNALKVTDHGEGIAQEDLSRIFEPFYTRKVMGRSGTGLGLTVVWGTVQDHGGTIDVKSGPGVGTSITVYFPIPVISQVEEQASGVDTSYLGSGESILVVDDVDYQREIACTTLARSHYNVESAASGEEAVELVKAKEFDLLVLDMVLDGGMDGLDTFMKIQKIRPHQKAIIASGFSESDRIQKMRELGVTICIQKPYTFDQLNQAVYQELNP